jgi:hypothetical protein
MAEHVARAHHAGGGRAEQGAVHRPDRRDRRVTPTR